MSRAKTLTSNIIARSSHGPVLNQMYEETISSSSGGIVLLTQATIVELFKNAPRWPMRETRVMVTPTAMRTIAILDRLLPAKMPICKYVVYCSAPMVMRATPDA